MEEPCRHLRLLRRRLPDPLWSQIRLEAERTLSLEPDVGPQLYQHVLLQPLLVDALVSIVSCKIEIELMHAMALQALVLDQLRLEDDKNIHMDVVALANRSPLEDSTALNALLFCQGLHCSVCCRMVHCLWKAGRTGLAYYVQSTVSSWYLADIHPACKMEGESTSAWGEVLSLAKRPVLDGERQYSRASPSAEPGRRWGIDTPRSGTDGIVHRFWKGRMLGYDDNRHIKLQFMAVELATDFYSNNYRTQFCWFFPPHIFVAGYSTG